MITVGTVGAVWEDNPDGLAMGDSNVELAIKILLERLSGVVHVRALQHVGMFEMATRDPGLFDHLPSLLLRFRVARTVWEDQDGAPKYLTGTVKAKVFN